MFFGLNNTFKNTFIHLGIMGLCVDHYETFVFWLKYVYFPIVSNVTPSIIALSVFGQCRTFFEIGLLGLGVIESPHHEIGVFWALFVGHYETRIFWVKYFAIGLFAIWGQWDWVLWEFKIELYGIGCNRKLPLGVILCDVLNLLYNTVIKNGSQ